MWQAHQKPKSCIYLLKVQPTTHYVILQFWPRLGNILQSQAKNLFFAQKVSQRFPFAIKNHLHDDNIRPFNCKQRKWAQCDRMERLFFSKFHHLQLLKYFFKKLATCNNGKSKFFPKLSLNFSQTFKDCHSSKLLTNLDTLSVRFTHTITIEYYFAPFGCFCTPFFQVALPTAYTSGIRAHNR